MEDGYRILTKSIVLEKNLSSLALWLYCHILCLVDDRDPTCKISSKYVTSSEKVSTSTANRAFRELKKAGLIEYKISMPFMYVTVLEYRYYKSLYSDEVVTRSVTGSVTRSVTGLKEPEQCEKDDIFGTYDDLRDGLRDGLRDALRDGLGADLKSVLVRREKRKRNTLHESTENRPVDKSTGMPLKTASKKEKTPAKSTAFIEEYKKAYQARYGILPIIAAKERALACRIIDAVGSDEAIRAVKHYVKMEDDWFKKSSHTLTVLSARLQSVIVHMDRNAPKPKIEKVLSPSELKVKEEMDALDKKRYEASVAEMEKRKQEYLAKL